MKRIKIAMIFSVFTLGLLHANSVSVIAQESFVDPIENPQEALDENLDLPDLYEKYVDLQWNHSSGY